MDLVQPMTQQMLPYLRSFTLPSVYLRDYAAEEWQLKKLNVAMDLLSSSIKHVLDLGCGTGWATEILRSRYWSVACDLSPFMLAQASDPRLLASGERLPFPNRSFDAVYCSEVLEHLPPKVCQHVVQEVERVASFEIVCSTPYRQDLYLDQQRCPQCGTVYHVEGHVHAFDEAAFARIFSEFSLRAWAVLGDPVGSTRGWVTRIGRMTGLLHYVRNRESICPQCGCITKAGTTNSASALTRYTDRWIRQLAKKQSKQHPYWIVGLFRRQSMPPCS